ncbi:MAG: shikimate dehydrogenase family protein [Pseudooceanicola sp.]
MLTAAAQVVFMIGHPVAHAATPERFAAWAEANGLDLLMTPLDLAPEGMAGFAAMLRRANNVRGAVVTAPHKQVAAGMADRLTEAAQRAGAANLLIRGRGGMLTGDNTDGAGFVAALSGHGVRARGHAALVIGCGGAGSAIAAALAEAGARLTLCDKAPARATALAARLACDARAAPLPATLESFDLVVNATATGLGGRGAVHDLEGLRPGTMVADVVTDPLITPLLKAAAARGAKVQSGAEMAAAQLPIILERLGLAESPGR